MTDRLPSWRPGPTRDRLITSLDGLVDVPVAERVALFDNDGTLWAERPRYIQLDFFIAALQARAAADPSIVERPEFAAVLNGDRDAMGELGIARIALALASMFDGIEPGAFTSAVREFVDTYRHPTLERPVSGLVYEPMLELLAELRRLDVTVGIVSGGGTEFVRAVSQELYEVPPELVVGTLIGYEFVRDDAGRPTLHRTTSLLGAANEGATKVGQIQSHLGRRPIIAAGNSAGDREMLEWAAASGEHGLAILIDHDDAEREFAYESRAATFDDAEPITDVADRLGWLTVSVSRDWSQVFPD